MVNRGLPKVTLMIVVRNEKEYIEKSLQSLLNQTYPKELTEIIIVDGLSTDGTKEWLQHKIKELQKEGRKIKLLNNPRKVLASGWNIGIKASEGEVVCRIDAHSEICPNYTEIGVRELLNRKDENVVCVGGILENVGFGFLGEAIANLFSSKFGVGNSPFRTGAKKPFFADTAVFGLYWKWVFEKIGYFDETLERNQDIVLHSKILESGYKFITHPDMRAKYYVRSTIPKLIKKAFSDGYWIMYSRKSYLRHKVPLIFILYLFSIPLLLFIIGPFYLAPLGVYSVLAFYFSIKSAKSYSNLALFPLFLIFHISYGLGSLKGLIDRFVKRRVS